MFVVKTPFPTKYMLIEIYNTITVENAQNVHMHYVSGCQKKRIIELASTLMHDMIYSIWTKICLFENHRM